MSVASKSSPPEIVNFVEVSDMLATAGQPSEAQLRELAAQGFQVVINLGLNDPRYCLPDEAGLVVDLGMEYHHIPVKFDQPDAQDLMRFFQLLQASRERKVLAHCAANYRVSVFVSLYGQVYLGWTLQQAIEHVRDIWEPDAVWRQFAYQARRRLGLLK